MANRKIQVDVTATTQGFTKGIGQAQQSAGLLERALGRLGPVGNALQGVLNRVGLSSLSMGAGIGGAAVVALGASIAVAEKAIATYVNLGERIREYSIITGQSAEESSRQVQAFQVLNVSEETAAAGAVKLSKAIETSPQKLRALGVEIAHNAQGNVDLGQTLLNVVSAYQATGDAAKKNEILLTAFGRGGAAMLPILNADAGQLRKLEADVSKVYTADDLQRVHDYEIAQRELKRSTDELGLNLGQALLPAQKAVVDSMNENIYVSKHLQERTDALANSNSQHYVNTRQVALALREEYRAAQDAQHQADLLAASEQAAANAALQEAADEKTLYDAMNKNIDANDKYTDTTLKLHSARLQVDADAKAYDDAVKKDGVNSAAAAQALQTYRQGVQGLAEDYLANARAAGEKAAAEREAAGGTMDVAEKTDIERVALERIRDALSPNDPLRKNLQGYIDEMNSIPKNVSTQFTNTFTTSGRAGGNVAQFDDGGVVPGPAGAPMPAIVHGGEVVLTRDQQKAVGGSTFHTTIHVNGAQDPQAVAREVARRLRYLTMS